MSNVHTRGMSILTSFRENLIFFVDNEMHRSSYRFSIQHDIYFASYRIFECSKTFESIVNLLPRYRTGILFISCIMIDIYRIVHVNG